MYFELIILNCVHLFLDDPEWWHVGIISEGAPGQVRGPPHGRVGAFPSPPDGWVGAAG